MFDETIVRGVNGDETLIKLTYKYKQPDKRANRDSIGRHFGLFERDNGQKRDQIIFIPDSRVNKGKA